MDSDAYVPSSSSSDAEMGGEGAGDGKEEDACGGEESVELRKHSTLHKIRWHRIMLDEAHKIKGRVNNTAKSVYALIGTYKWAITGALIGFKTRYMVY